MKWNDLKEKINSFCHQPDKVFILSTGIALFCSLCYCCFFTDIHRDTAGVYALYASEIARGDFKAGIVTNVPMFNIVLGGLLARCGVEVLTALTIVSGLFYIGALFPLRAFLARYVTPLMAAWGCVLYACAPKLVLFSCSPLLESARIFFLLGALLFFFRSADKGDWRDALLCGIFCGGLTVSRGEGIAISAALLGGYLPFLWLFRKQKICKKHFISFALAVVCCGLVTTPFCAMNYIKSGYFVTDTRAVDFFTKVASALQNSQHNTAGAGQVFMSEEEGNTSWGEKICSVFSGIARGGYEVYIAAALIGLFFLLRKKMWKSDYFVWLALTLMLCTIYTLVVSSYRYYLFLTPLFMVFTVTGLDQVRKGLHRILPEKGLFYVGIFCALCLAMQVGNGISRAFSNKGVVYRKAGEWIAEYGRKNHPARPLRVYAYHIPEVIFWSKAVHVNAYGNPPVDGRTAKDFDLAVIRKGYEKIFFDRKDLEEISSVPGSGKKLFVFRLKKMEKRP